MQFTKIAEALVGYSHGGSPSLIPRVTYKFTYNPNDIDLSNSWLAEITLEGVERLDDNGEAVKSSERSWALEGNTPEEAFDRAVVALTESLMKELTVKQSQSTAITNALNHIALDGEPPPPLWAQTKEEAASLAAKEEEGDGWTGSEDEPKILILSPDGLTPLR